MAAVVIVGALVLFFAALRALCASVQSISSSLYTTMLVSPAVVFASLTVVEHFTGRGTGLASVFGMGVSLGVSVVGLVGLALNGCALLLASVKRRDFPVRRGLRTLLRVIAVVLPVGGALIAYIVWPTEGALHPTGAVSAARMAASIAIAAWCLYLGRVLWV